MTTLSASFNNQHPTRDERDAFVRAARSNDAETIYAFMDTFGKNILDSQDHNGNTALIWAIRNAQEDLVITLLQAGADKEIKDNDGMTPLMWTVATGGKEKFTKTLLLYGANIDATDVAGWTALRMARSWGHLESLEILSEWMGDMDYVDMTKGGIQKSIQTKPRLILKKPTA